MLNKVLFIMKERNVPYLNMLIEDLEEKGIDIFYTFEYNDLNSGDDTYIITDCEDGIELARNYNIGYIAYFPDEYNELPCPDAQCVFRGFDELTADFVIKMYERFMGIPWTILETERCIVREMSLKDIDELYELYDQPGITDYIPGLCKYREEEVEFERAYIKLMYEFCGYGIWNIIDKESGKIIGRAGIANRDGFDDPEIGYLVGKDYQNRGIAKEVVSAIIKYGRSMLGFSRFNAFVHDENIPSIKLITGLGFKKVGYEIIEKSKLGHYVLLTSVRN
ncbi:MAG: GNAT family N-acetyltransferase [Lachnospiraceae bacterium]|nr:GNAT family N-acetyltransferase [Lachnospiraceae bacterium]